MRRLLLAALLVVGAGVYVLGPWRLLLPGCVEFDSDSGFVGWVQVGGYICPVQDWESGPSPYPLPSPLVEEW